mgnify:CR=1 FL=1
MAAVTAAVVGIASAGFSAVQGFSSAAKAKNAAEAADKAAAKAMSEAKAKAQVDMYAGLNVPLDAYEAEFENQIAGQKQAIEALQEGDSRALAARAQGISQGVAGIAGVAGGIGALAPLYGQSGADRRGSKLAKQYANQKPEGMTDAQYAANIGAQGLSRKDYKSLSEGRGQYNFKDNTLDNQTQAGFDYSNQGPGGMDGDESTWF